LVRAGGGDDVCTKCSIFVDSYRKRAFWDRKSRGREAVVFLSWVVWKLCGTPAGVQCGSERLLILAQCGPEMGNVFGPGDLCSRAGISNAIPTVSSRNPRGLPTETARVKRCACSIRSRFAAAEEVNPTAASQKRIGIRGLGTVTHCPNHFLLLTMAQFGGSSNLHAAIPSSRQAGPRYAVYFLFLC